LQATKLSAVAAATKVQLSFSSKALKSHQALEKKLQTRLAKLQAEEAQHKQTVTERHKQLRQLQEQQAAADAELAAATQAAAEEHDAAGGLSKRGRRAGVAGSVDTAVPTGLTKELQQLQQQLATAEAELSDLQGLQSAAASKATRAAAAVAGLQASVEEVETAAAKSTQQLQQAAAAVQQATADATAGRAAVEEAEQAWKDAHMQQRTLQVRGLNLAVFVASGVCHICACIHSTTQLLRNVFLVAECVCCICCICCTRLPRMYSKPITPSSSRNTTHPAAAAAAAVVLSCRSSFSRQK
jgi:chromosome segregation ATPase